MIPIISNKQARYLDRKTIQLGTSEAKLMKNAGRGIAQFFIDNIINPFSQSVLVIAGPGNNGGDAIIAHYYLNFYGIESTLMVVKKIQLKSKLLNNYRIPNDKILVYETAKDLPSSDWIIDGIFGIGISRNITVPYSNLINQLNKNSNIISVDIPSGINSNTGKKSGYNVISAITLTFGYPKLGHILNDGINATGELHSIDIGFTDIKLETPNIHLLTLQDIKKLIKPLKIDINKYSRGKVGIFSGSIGMTGAGILVAKSAFKSGAGIIRMVIPKSLNNIFESKLIETITEPLDDNNLGYLTKSNISEIKKIMDWSDCLICGPGLSSQPKSKSLIKSVLTQFNNKLILDGTGFSPLIDGKIKLSDISKKSILTPHYAEFSRLFNYNITDIKNNPLKAIKSVLSELQGRVLILKGAPTFICTSDGDIEICNYGIPTLATAGTGDVLSGILGGLLSQDYSINDVARIGVILHSLSANIYLENISEQSLTASDLIGFISQSWRELLSE